MNSEGFTEFLTVSGCTVRIYPTGPDVSDMGGVWSEPGAMMVLAMEQSGDGRRVELHLTPGETSRLRNDLGIVLVGLVNRF